MLSSTFLVSLLFGVSPIANLAISHSMLFLVKWRDVAVIQAL